ncbi:hypothetical protein [Sphingomonas carotinifaciens]|uniref:Sporadically distributed protein, TIGR04141 family n=1 Tax=Sphingomonas carotinifaciens TaxID=1166323 RepID=A0A1G7NGI7_9SPHN|nr:hypothetical protein [Sphingomonas carotinifaciens]MBB4087109.1 hypothetical protein [Sphingomonas carotinifaciens]MWC43204.1 hypothetical protein [Sphingomonas carotinifaciens]SDF72419.1 hypothetical protein SAMN05216557_105136 [Sphingomonas carotinifaciens]
MATPPNTAILRPFLAPLLLRRRATTRADRFLSTLCAEIDGILGSDVANGPRETSAAHSYGGLRVRTIGYVEVRAPAWAPESLLMNVQHHLIVVATKGDLAGVCASRSGLLGGIARVGCAALVERSVIEAAFVGSRASVIWMNGIHEDTDSKPSAKTLMGTALEYALDPLGDQTFHYSAMRSTVPLKLDGTEDASIGAFPGNSRVWTSRPKDWGQFAARLEMLIDRVAAPPAPSGRFGMLARSLDDLGGVDDAYEVGFVPSELFGASLDRDEIRSMESWALATDLEIVATDRAALTARVVHQGTDLGDVRIEPSMSEGRIAIEAEWIDVRYGTDDDRDVCLDHLRDVDWTKIRYGSGHTLSHGGCYTSAYRDQRFDWRFVDLTGYDVACEKPAVAAGQTLAGRIGSKVAGAVDNSLFGYVFDEFGGSGWLASDDGSMEIADFIHIADDDLVTLFHVKAAGSDRAGREVSASKFEVVVGQAVKNLRHLDRTTLADALGRNHDNLIGSAVWLAGSPQADRTGMIRRARDLPPGYARRVVILQPQLTRTEYNACNDRTAGATRILKMKQLHTLMLGARLSAGAVGASLEGWGAA